MNEANTVGAFDAKTHLSALLERVAEGESFVITRRGTPIARLVPASPGIARASVDELVSAATALRGEIRASGAEIRSWIDEGRA